MPQLLLLLDELELHLLARQEALLRARGHLLGAVAADGQQVLENLLQGQFYNLVKLSLTLVYTVGYVIFALNIRVAETVHLETMPYLLAEGLSIKNKCSLGGLLVWPSTWASILLQLITVELGD